MSFRSCGRHARHDFAEPRVSVAELLARRDAEHSKAKIQASYAWPRLRLAAENADTIINLPAVIDAEVVDPWQDIECDGGRPMHELDYAQVTGGAR